MITAIPQGEIHFALFLGKCFSTLRTVREKEGGVKREQSRVWED